MLSIDPVTPTIGAEISGIDFSGPIPPSTYDEIYQALLKYLVIFVRGTSIAPAAHLAFAQNFGELDEPHPLYPHVKGFKRIVLLENDSSVPLDTNCSVFPSYRPSRLQYPSVRQDRSKNIPV